ncbi:hypothetical protein HBF26_17665 [Luteibacter jiangsuensis]|uniref:Uncharacterized protein n=1 Tax=Luteibacter jiangsuensis TaxID=637577 RepID=A0ABX0Q8L1_9GAMM|nr:hypothetical protein [Luteibacter jiangsuensis]NID06723.1 hypothetical protein [Luteibacter jiangsuensis]
MSSIPFVNVFTQDAHAYLGQVISTRGVLVIREGRAVVVPGFGSADVGSGVEIFFPGLEKLLDSRVGGWVGGQTSYFDAVEISGLLSEATTRAQQLALSRIRRLILERDAEVHIVV